MSESFFDLFDNLKDGKQGGSSTVYKATYKKIQITVALKKIEIDPEYPEDFESLQNEIKFHKNIDYPLILHFYGSSTSETKSFVILEYGGEQSLLQYINNRGPLTEGQAKKFFIQLISSLQYLHTQCHLLHSDIKLENILIDSQNNAILIDFGLCCTLGSVNPGFAGTIQYTAPEVFDKVIDSTGASDIWSAGIVLYAMLEGCLPFGGELEDAEEIVHEIQTKPLDLSESSNLSPKAKALISRILTKNPSERIKIQEFVNDPWIADSPYASLLSYDSTVLQSLKRLPTTVNEIDNSIMKEIIAIGFEKRKIIEHILARSDTEDVLYYRIKKLQSILKQIYQFRAAQYKLPREIPLVSRIPSQIPCYTIKKKRLL